MAAAESAALGKANGLLERAAAEHDHDRHGARGLLGQNQRQRELDLDRGIARIVDATGQLAPANAMPAELTGGGRGHPPLDFRDISGNAANHLALELLDGFRPSELPPLVCCRDCVAVISRQQIGPVRIRVGDRLVIVGRVRRIVASARPGPERGDPELPLHVCMVLLGGPFRRSPILSRDCTDGTEREAGDGRNRKTGWSSAAQILAPEIDAGKL